MGGLRGYELWVMHMGLVWAGRYNGMDSGGLDWIGLLGYSQGLDRMGCMGWIPNLHALYWKTSRSLQYDSDISNV